MSELYKSLFLSNDNDKIITTFLNLIIEKKEKDALKFLYELISFFISEINSKNLKGLISLLKDKYNKNALFKEFLDYYLAQTLWIFGVKINISQLNQSQKNEKENIKDDNFKSFVNILINENLITKINLLEKLEETTLDQIGLIEQKEFRNKFTKINTKLFEHHKFNLLREESEGYSKLISFLFDINELKKKLDENEIEIVLEKIVKIIGYFNLDSYRVLDIALEVFKYSPFNINYIKIFDILNKKTILPIIDFKFSENPNDKKLMIIVAQLIHFNYISLEDLVSRITPSLSELQQIFVTKYQGIFDYIQNSLSAEIKNQINTIIDLGSSTKNTANYFCNFKEIISKAINNINQENKNNNFKKSKINQFYLLFEAFIAIKDKKNIIKMYNLVKEFYDPLENIGVIEELCELIKWMISPLVKSGSNINNNVEQNNENKDENYIRQCFSFGDFIKNVPEILKILNIGLSNDQILFQKLFIIMNDNIKEIKNNIDKFNDLFINVFFPSLSLIDPCPSLLNLFWKYLNDFDYKMRYKLYEQWILKSYKIHPYLVIKSIVVWKEIQKWQKCLSLENARKSGRILQIITNSNPIIAFDSIINILILYENQISPVIGALNFCSYLSYDVITYTICKILHEKKTNIDKENIGIDKHFKNFCDFISLFYKKYYNSEINGVFNFIIDRFNKFPGNMDVYILKELIEKMSGIHTQEELNEEQIISESGGYKLYFYLECKILGKELKSLKKPTATLMKVIQSNDNLICLFLLLNLQKRKVLYIQKHNFRLMCFIYDRIHLINLQFQKLLNYHGKNEVYNKILEKIPVDILIEKYHFSPQTIFNLLRKRNKKIYELTSEEYTNNSNEFKNIYDKYVEHKKKFLENEFDAIYLEKDDFINGFYKSPWVSITPKFYYIFNSLELTDIVFPKNEYDKQIEDLNNKLRLQLNQNNEKMKSELEGLTNEKRNLISHHQKVLDFLKINLENILIQNSSSINQIKIPETNITDKKNEPQENNKESISLNNINQTKNTLEANSSAGVNVPMEIEEKNEEEKFIINKKELTQSLIQYLFYPRIIISKDDAIYVQKLISLLILNKGDTINTIDILNKIPKYLLKAILCVTECEAENIGLFLNSFLTDIQNFQNDDFWEQNCKKNISFSRKLEEIDIVELKDFKKAFNEVIKNITSSIEKMIENEKENYNIRNIIIMINKIPIIPPSKEKAESLFKALSSIQKKNQNQPFVLLESYKNELKKKFKLDSDKDNIKSENDNKSENNHKKDRSHNSKKSEVRYRDKEYRKKDRSKDRSKDRPKDRDNERNKDRDRDWERGKDRSRDRSRDKSRDRSRDRGKNRDDKNNDKRKNYYDKNRKNK